MSTPVTEPEFCPNRECRFHSRELAEGYQWYRRFGRFHTACRSWIQRFRCVECGRTCSTQTFSVHYWTHFTYDMVRLGEHLYGCGGLRQSGRFDGVTYRVIQNRTRRLARNALAVMDLALWQLNLREDVALDGFESYTRSQYHPNNITHVAGSDSQFIYAAAHTLLRRKGRMTPAQKRARKLIDLVWKPVTTIKDDTTMVLSDLSESIAAACKRREKVCLSTDEHHAYPLALKAIAPLEQELKAGRLIHRKTSSRAARTRTNPLFSVNYVDRQMRKNMAEHVRETVRQGREVNCQMERMAVFMVLHNFATPHRITDKANSADGPTHARIAGIDSEALRQRLDRMTTHRHVSSHNQSGHKWIERIWQHLHENPPVVRRAKGEIQVRPVALGLRKLPAHLLA
jgi:hypothetical protein